MYLWRRLVIPVRRPIYGLPWLTWQTQPTILMKRQIITKTCTILLSIYSFYSIYLLNIRQIWVWNKWHWIFIFFGTLGPLANICNRNSRLFNLGEMSCFNQHNAVQWIWVPYHLQTYKVVHLCFITSPGKIFAVLELWLSPLQWFLNW